MVKRINPISTHWFLDPYILAVEIQHCWFCMYTACWQMQPNPIGYYAQASTLNETLIGLSIILLTEWWWSTLQDQSHSHVPIVTLSFTVKWVLEFEATLWGIPYQQRKHPIKSSDCSVGSSIGSSTMVKEGKTRSKVGASSSNGIGSDVITLPPTNWLVSLRMVFYLFQNVPLPGWIISHGRKYVSLGERELILLCPHLISISVIMAMSFMNLLHSTRVAMERGSLTGDPLYLVIDALLIHYEGCSWALAWESIIFIHYSFLHKSIYMFLSHTSL